MNRYHKNLLTPTLLAMLSATASAQTISGRFVDDARCDTIPNQLLTRELGDANFFPASTGISYHDHRLSFGISIGVSDDGIANDWTVHMTNVSGQAWKDLFLVADDGATIGNSDGQLEDMIGAPGRMNDAFRIDASGINANLLFESMNQDGIFEPGEQWEFGVMNFGTGFNSAPPTIITPGIFSGSSQLGPNGGIGSGNASIVATPVPEPMGLVFTLIGSAALLLKRPYRTQQSH